MISVSVSWHWDQRLREWSSDASLTHNACRKQSSMCCCKPDNETEDVNTECVILKNHGIKWKSCSAMMSPRRKLGMNLTGFIVQSVHLICQGLRNIAAPKRKAGLPCIHRRRTPGHLLPVQRRACSPVGPSQPSYRPHWGPRIQNTTFLSWLHMSAPRETGGWSRWSHQLPHGRLVMGRGA